jgi:hypothetical protein
MRSCVRAFAATLVVLLGPSCANAQFPTLTEAARQLDELHSAVRSIKLVKVSGGEGTHAYFDVMTENVCNGAVATRARNWVQQWGFSAVFNRLVVMNAVVAYPDNRGTQTVPLLVDSNMGGVYPACQPIVALAIPRYKRVHITIELVSKSGIDEATAQSVRSVLSGVTGAMGKLSGLWGKVALGAGAVLAAVAPDAASLAKLFTRTRPSTSDQIAFGVGLERVHFVLGDQPVFSLRPEPRPQLLAYLPGEPADRIPDAISTVSAKSWDSILHDATGDQEWWASARALARFCVLLRDKLSEALQHDPLAISLGLYYHSLSHSGEYERLGRPNCLSHNDLEELKREGYLPVS